MGQPGWAQQLPRVFNEVKSIEIAPLDEGKDFDLYVDDVQLVLAPGKPNPFGCPMRRPRSSTARPSCWTGKLGKAASKLWPWASLAINIEPNATPTDLSAVKGIHFWAKGSGAFRAVITRKAVTDYGNFGTAFGGPKEWKQIVIPLDDMKQADCAQKVPHGFPDAGSDAVDAKDCAPSDYDIVVIDNYEIGKGTKTYTFNDSTSDVYPLAFKAWEPSTTLIPKPRGGVTCGPGYDAPWRYTSPACSKTSAVAWVQCCSISKISSIRLTIRSCRCSRPSIVPDRDMVSLTVSLWW